MKIVLAGGSGQVGGVLARAFHAAGDEVCVLSRSPRPAPWRTVAWDARAAGPWERELAGAAVVVGLAGRSVNCRYTAANRRAILDSRVEATRALGEALARCGAPPRAWLQMSTATIYAHRLDAPNDEASGLVGNGPDEPASWRFSIEVARRWEAAARESCPWGVRLLLLRAAMVMSPDRGGIFDTLLGMVRRGLGGRAGDGRQYVSWIHEHDFVAALRCAIADQDLGGPLNVASPEPLPYADFVRALRAAAGVRFGLPATRWMLELGALVMRTETELVLKSRRVVPARLLERGFRFAHPSWPEAARELCARWRASR